MVVKTLNSGFEQADDPFRRYKDARTLTQFISSAEILIKQSDRRAA